MMGMKLDHFSSTTASEKKKRKRIQNRLNQRAYRLRNRQAEGGSAGNPRRSREYQIVRWRLDEEGVAPSTYDLSISGSGERADTAQNDLMPDELFETWFPLPIDQQLLHLIQYNVFRGLYRNKTVVQSLTMQYHINSNNQAEPFADNSKYPSYSVILPVSPVSLPESLTPTSSQMNIVHSSWINALPFPKMRENLIKFEFDFDHAELVKDLVGNLINSKIFLSIPSPFQWRVPPSDRQTVPYQREEYDNDGKPGPAVQSGLIVWGEPYKPESWEATPEFLRKWTWALEGCHELLDATNSRRKERGEGPLQLPPETSRQ